jgi:hypothetical protein
MKLVLLTISGYMVAAGLLLLVRPDLMQRFAERSMTGAQRYLWAAVAGGFGLLMVWAAPVSRAPLFIQVLGAWALLKGVLILALPAASLSRFIGWWLGLPRQAHHLWGLTAAALGLALYLSVVGR